MVPDDKLNTKNGTDGNGLAYEKKEFGRGEKFLYSRMKKCDVRYS